MRMPRAIAYAAVPVLAAVYPVVSLYSRNTQYPLGEVGPCVGWAALGGLSLYLLLLGLYRDATKAAVLTLPAIALFFLNGLFSEPFRTVAGGEATEGKSLARGGLELLYALLWCGFGVLVLVGRRWRPFSTLARVGAVGVLGTIAIPLLLLLMSTTQFLVAAPVASVPTAAAVPTADGPDIYYIVLDAYAREDVLRELFGVDNGEFLDALRARGFFVANRSRANYLMTHLSLASSLNFDYLDDAIKPGGRVAGRNCYRLVQDNAATRFLKSRGYTHLNVSSGYWLTSPLAAADVEVRDAGVELREFRHTIIKMTPLRSWRDAGEVHRNRILFGLNALPEVAARAERKFVLAHIVCPHPPFVFDRSGAPLSLGVVSSMLDGQTSGLSREQYIVGYREQLLFLNTKLIEAIDAILTKYPPEKRPVIILQGDHGSGLAYNWEFVHLTHLPERAPILMAALLPADRRFEVSEAMTPVNLFRIVFNGLFDAKLPLLPDKTYFVPSNRLEAYVELPAEALDPVTSPLQR